MPSFTRTLIGIAPLYDTNLTVIFTKHDVKAYNQAGTTILEGWRNPGGANNWHSPIVYFDYIINEDSLFPSDDKVAIIPSPTLLQNLIPCQPHKSPTPTGTASSTRSGQPEQYS
jgi:hypothetical protein